MSSSNKLFTIFEYGGFVQGALPFGKFQPLPERTFKALEEFILSNNSNSDAVELLSLSVRRGIGKIITAHNYVGLITTKDGTVIEILPKIYNGGIDIADTKRIFLEMLKTLKDVSFKDFNLSNLHVDRLSIFEIFIAMFVEEVSRITKQGLKSYYTLVEENARFFKGKLSVTQNIKANLISRERFYVKYDEWSINRPENRLIKSTLSLLYKQSRDDRNRHNISRLLTYFNGADDSRNFDADLNLCAADRSVSHYEKALSWCKIFLRGNSFSPYSGSEVAVALLFPMEKVFESYVVAKLRQHLLADIEMRTQDNRYYLFDRPTRTFSLRPDIVLTHRGKTVIIDTKWKLLSNNSHNYGISQADMYQMYAYGKKYGAEKTVLLYPQSSYLENYQISFHSDDGINIEIYFFDLLRPDICAVELTKRFCNT